MNPAGFMTDYVSQRESVHDLFHVLFQRVVNKKRRNAVEGESIRSPVCEYHDHPSGTCRPKVAELQN